MSDIRKVAIVTGASQGLGEGIVRAFRNRNYVVVATSRSIAASGDPELVTVTGDIGDPDTGRRVVAAALERFGRIDTLVNNAGIYLGGPFTDYTAEQYRLKLKTNLDGFFFTTREVIPVMLRQNSGHVVKITDNVDYLYKSRAPSVLASLTKGGLNAATRSLAIEYAARGIRANAVAPGIMRTPLHPAAAHERLADAHPLKRMGEIEDVAQAVLYLDEASFVTGEILHVDGGLAAGR